MCFKFTAEQLRGHDVILNLNYVDVEVEWARGNIFMELIRLDKSLQRSRSSDCMHVAWWFDQMSGTLEDLNIPR